MQGDVGGPSVEASPLLRGEQASRLSQRSLLG